MPTIAQRLASAFAVRCGQNGDVTQRARVRSALELFTPEDRIHSRSRAEAVVQAAMAELVG
ncbi:MAG: hypothetical protein JO284_18750, partial [Planctomycetaceae bacterium]|nr:hypothetical protein [Planctomycetaceae bacterium]